jgi:hypothetical protein
VGDIHQTFVKWVLLSDVVKKPIETVFVRKIRYMPAKNMAPRVGGV